MTSAAEVDVGTHVPIDRIVDRVAPLALVGSGAGLEVTGITFDHRQVEPGFIFCCLVGAHSDGHRFAGSARRAGATSFICEHTLGSEVGSALQLVVGPGLARPSMARAACAFYDDPATAMRTVGVTGTNGKTTTTYLLRAILERAGMATGVIGTLGGARTTPEAPELQRLLAGMRARHLAACAMEVTSHALVQHRVDGIRFDVAVFTNLSQDHLDYHQSMESYFEAKSELFTPERARFAVVNADDPYGRRLLDRHDIPMASYSLDDVADLEVGLDSSRFRLGRRQVRLAMGGVVNVQNALAAASAARALGTEPEAIVDGLAAAEPVPGRFETMRSETGVVGIVDFAHTPAGLEELLLAARRHRPEGSGGSVICVFGCGGDRDRGKRPAMGEVASRLADLVVLTNDNPRRENPASIVDEVRAGMSGPAEVIVELDRRRAIADAMQTARPGDVVVVAGKGHETTQEFADSTLPFDDRLVVRFELDRLTRRARRERAELDPPAGQ